MRVGLITAVLILAGCNMQSPKPVYTAEEAEARAACERWNISDARYGGAGDDPIAFCMQAYQHGWRPSK